MNDDGLGFRVALLSIFISCVFTFLTTGTLIDTAWEKYLVKEGHAEYYLDSNNEKQFRLLPTTNIGHTTEEIGQ